MNAKELNDKLAALETHYRALKEENAQLRAEVDSANSKVAALNAKANESQKLAAAPIFSIEKLEAAADACEQVGLLPSTKKVAFVTRLKDHPEELVDSMVKIAGFISARQMGGPDINSPAPSPAALDPIAAWALDRG